MNKFILIMVISMSTMVANAQNLATYYQFVQENKPTELSTTQFFQVLPFFIESTVALNRSSGLNNYLVAIPPTTKPSFVPDKFALLAFNTKSDYLTSPLSYFNNVASSRLPLVTLDSSVTAIQFGEAYNVIGKPVDWSGNYVMFFLGLRLPGVSTQGFQTQMTTHIRDTADKLGPQGLNGYLMMATEDYEVAYLAFGSKQESDAAFASADGTFVKGEAGAMMNIIMFAPSEPFNASTGVQSGGFYSTIQTN